MDIHLNIHNTNKLTSVWCDKKANINNKKVYISTLDKTFIIDLKKQNIAADYTVEGIRVDKVLLDSNDITDLNVV